MSGVVADGVYFNTDSGLSAPGGLLDQLTNPDTQLKVRQVAAVDAFSGGLPKRADGSVDTDAMARTMFQKGDFGTANQLLQTGLQQGLAQAQKNAASIGTFGGDGASAPSMSNYTRAQPGFDSAVDWTMAREGGLNPKDTNGTPSNYGINQAAHPDIDVTKLTPDQAKGIYKSQYWDAIGADSMPAPLARVAFDTAVMVGPARAKQMIADSGGDPLKLVDLRQQYQQGLIAQDPQKFGPYAKAWTARNNGARFDVGALNASASAATDPSAASGPVNGVQNANGVQQSQSVSVAQNGTSDAPIIGAHPYGAGVRGPQRASATDPGAGGSDVAPAAPMQIGPGTAAPDTSLRPIPTPTRPTTPTALSPNAGALPPPADPTFGGQVPQLWLKAGRSATDWVAYARSQAALNSAIPGGYGKGNAEQWGKIADGLEASIQKASELTPEQKNARDPTAIAYEQARDTNKAQARALANTATAGQHAEATQEGEALGKIPGQLATAADSARNQNSMIDEMVDASRQFQMGKFADRQQYLSSTMSAVGHSLGVDTSSIDGKVAAYEDFGKLAGQFSRQATKEVGGARGVQEIRLIGNTLPSPTMSQGGFESVTSQLKGANDYNIAKQAAGESWLEKTGSMRGFDTNWNQNVTPGAFVLHRLQTDQPDVFAQTVTRLAQSPAGRAALQSMKRGMSFAGNAGLFD